MADSRPSGGQVSEAARWWQAYTLAEGDQVDELRKLDELRLRAEPGGYHFGVRSWMNWLKGSQGDDRHARLTGNALLVMALGLTAWIFYLGSTLPNQGPVQDWGTSQLGLGTWQLTWVGLDVFEVAGLAATGYLLRRAHRQTRTAALLAAPVFVVDGWFDLLTAASRSDLAVSLATLAVAELPTALFLLLVARKARQFEYMGTEIPAPAGKSSIRN